jgi:hypothetical protein
MTQTGKSTLWIGGLALAAVALGLYAFFGVAKPEEQEKARKDADERLFSVHAAGERAADGGLPPDAVFTSLLIKAKGETTALEKKDGVWAITQPVRALADGFAVDQLTGALQSSKFKDLVEENPSDQDLVKYGLKEPKLTVTGYAYIPDAEGKGADDPSRRKQVTLYGGIENSFDGSFYVRREGEKAVHSVEGGARYSLEKNTFDLRGKEVLGFEEPKVTRVAVKTQPNAYALQRASPHSWRVAAPFQEPADDTAVTGLFNAWRNERATAFPSADAKTQALFDSPALDAQLAVEAAGTVHVRLAKVDKAVWALVERGTESTLAEVPETAVSDLDKNPQDLRDKTVVAFSRDAVARVTFTKAGGPTLTAQQEKADGGEETWRVTEPQKGLAKKWKLTSLLWSLSSLKATRFGDAKPKSWAKYGLDKPGRSVTLMDVDGKVLAKLDVGAPVDAKGAAVYVRGTPDAVLELDPTRLSELPTTVDDLLDTAPPEAADAGEVTTSKN